MPSIPVALEVAAFIFMFVMPTTWPCILMSGPPELPSLMAALVCRSVIEWLLYGMSRLMAEIMPFVRVPRSSAPKGLPMAATASPTLTWSEQNSAAVRPSASIFRTARSLTLSMPTSRASNSLSSQSVTEAE